MRKCPKCNSLVPDDVTEHCGLPLDPRSSTISATATVALSPEQLAKLTTDSRPVNQPRPQSAAARRPTGQPARPAPPPRAASSGFVAVAARNRAADRALALGLLAILPLFPIALAAFVYGILGLSFAAQAPDAPGRGKSWFGVLSGALFGVAWTAVTVSLLMA